MGEVERGKGEGMSERRRSWCHHTFNSRGMGCDFLESCVAGLTTDWDLMERMVMRKGMRRLERTKWVEASRILVRGGE